MVLMMWFQALALVVFANCVAVVWASSLRRLVTADKRRHNFGGFGVEAGDAQDGGACMRDASGNAMKQYWSADVTFAMGGG